MSQASENRPTMYPQILRFDEPHTVTTPIAGSLRDEPDDSVLNGPQFRGRCPTTERELLQNQFDENLTLPQ